MLKIQSLRQEGERVIIKIFNPDDGYSSEQTFDSLKHFKNYLKKYEAFNKIHYKNIRFTPNLVATVSAKNIR